MGEITLVAANGGNDDRKDKRFDKSTPNINNINGGLNAGKVCSCVGTKEHNPREISTQDPKEVKKGCQ
jgi:hypothetical protein